jgi:O-antigen/teichoic acid export membrane protein
MLAAPVYWLCNAMLVNQPNGYAEMGILNAVNQWFYAVLFLPSALVSNAMPILSERLAVDDRSGSRQALALSLKLTVVVVLPVVLLGCLGSRYIMGIYGSAFTGHWPTLLVALATGGVLAIQIPIGQIVIASGQMWLLTGMQILWALILCGTTWALLPFGALGLVSARLLAYVIHTCLTSAFVWWRLK